LHVGVVAVQITLFGRVQIRCQKREDITIRGKFDMSRKSELGIVQEVGTRKAELEIDMVMPTTLA